ncbi:PEP-CTERM sorting domain-containing protein [Algisphaera agarilytica]|uniref:Ice-binding protein C-terminal domain-containing protein n=1 Tax=Algisphaera agarilytica TaxID=1385975 RepID=A0A7X0H7B1_9BACT|nr:PEP-CTERM sorting domain-containing protein [Algisphaera agarilytica]MBB6429130.1 hypothetical protein [Algisphaera agarilytica]
MNTKSLLAGVAVAAVTTSGASAAVLSASNTRLAFGPVANGQNAYDVNITTGLGGGLTYEGEGNIEMNGIPDADDVMGGSAGGQYVVDYAFYNGTPGSDRIDNGSGGTSSTFLFQEWAGGAANVITFDPLDFDELNENGEGGSDGGDNRMDLFVDGSQVLPLGSGGSPEDGADNTARLAEGSFTIDLTGLTSGSVFVFHGGFNNGTNDQVVTATIGATSMMSTVDPANDLERAQYVSVFEYDTSAGTTLDLDFIINGNSGSRSRFAGIVVTDVVPEPGSLALLGAGSVLMAVRRRSAR